MRTQLVLTHVAEPLHCNRSVPFACSSQTRAFSALPVKELWRSVNAVCFDVDSTVCEDEGIDVLADHCGAGAAVKEWTNKYVVRDV